MNTNLEVQVDIEPKVAGIERGRLHNDWLDCNFEIHPGPPGARGCTWRAVFFAIDDPTLKHSFNGVGATRAQATAAALDTLTRRMRQVAETRAAAQGLRIVADGGVTVPIYRKVGVFQKVWASIVRAYAWLVAAVAR